MSMRRGYTRLATIGSKMIYVFELAKIEDAGLKPHRYDGKADY